LRALSKKISETFEDVEQAKIELESFRSLNSSEKFAIPKRIESLQGEFDHLVGREHELQQRYSTLSTEKQEIQQRIDGLLQELREKKDANPPLDE